MSRLPTDGGHQAGALYLYLYYLTYFLLTQLNKQSVILSTLSLVGSMVGYPTVFWIFLRRTDLLNGLTGRIELGLGIW